MIDLPGKRLLILILFLFSAGYSAAAGTEPRTALTPAAEELLRLFQGTGDSLIVSGQFNSAGLLNRCTNRIEEIAGVTPAIWAASFDFSGRVDNGFSVMQEAYRKHRQGYIVALAWSPSNPNFDPPFDSSNPGYNELRAADWKEITTPGSKLYQRFRRDMDRIAWYLKELQRMGVPVLWNPLPAINSGQHWYAGRPGKAGSVFLWETVFERFLQHHGLKNLVWVWSVCPGKSEYAEFIEFLPRENTFHVAALDGSVAALDNRTHTRLVQAAGTTPVGLIGAEGLPGVSLIEKYPRFSFFVTAAEQFDETNGPEQVLELYQSEKVINRKQRRREWKPVAANLPAGWRHTAKDSLRKLLTALKQESIDGAVISETGMNAVGRDSLTALAGFFSRAGLEPVYACEYNGVDSLLLSISIAGEINASLMKISVQPASDALLDFEEIALAFPVIDSMLTEYDLHASLDFHPAIPFAAVQQSLEICKSVRIGLHLDPAYCLINGLDPGHIARTMAPFITSVQFTDYALLEDEAGWWMSAVPAGQGNAGLEYIMEALKEYGNTGYAFVEPVSTEGSPRFHRGELQALQQCLFPQRPELQKVYGPDAAPSLRDKIEGMLIGSAIGDAAGGPVEFALPIQRGYWATTDGPLTQKGVEELAAQFVLRDYPKDIEPYAQWEPFGPAGTVTDDTRFKFILFNTLRDNDGKVDAVSFAREILEFREEIRPEYRQYYDEWIPEIRYAARWMLKEERGAFPTERIWGGVPTMMGQMPFLPVAALNPSDPQWCYKTAFETAFFDNGSGRDINAAIVAGLARALQQDGSWLNAVHAMRVTDPYRYNDLLYVERGLEKWIAFSHKMVKESRGTVAELFGLLENYMQTEYWWEAWVPLVVVLSCAEITGYHPLASMQLMIEFGHDTDSYAQVMGAFMGAIHGKAVFPAAMRNSVNLRMKEQYGENIDDWLQLIQQYGRQAVPGD